MKLLKIMTAFGLLALCVAAQAQIPRINTFFPIGAKAGSSVEVEVRGSSLEGANLMLVHGKGVSGTVSPGNAKVDETNKPLWQNRCGSCHELRSPANRSLTPGQWASTVERMVKVRAAPLSADETAKVSQYLVGAARAGRVTAQIAVAPDTLPGLYEVRLATPRGVSSPYWFEVGALPEVMAANVSREQAQPVTLPCVANGCFMSTGERHFFKFSAKKGDREIFNLKAFRYNESNQFYFSPNLRLYDSAGKRLVENHGYYDLDPLIDWECPADGTYTLEVRDLLGRPNPGSVYRLTMGKIPYDLALSPLAGQAGAKVTAEVTGKATEGLPAQCSFEVPMETGVVNTPTPFGSLPFYVSQYPVVRNTGTGVGISATNLPATFAGVIAKPGAIDAFSVQGNGVYEFNAYTRRLNSPIALSAKLVAPDGKAVGIFTRDLRMTAKLEQGVTYSLRVGNVTGLGDATMGYVIEARPARPVIECVLRPNNITLRPGVSVAAMVIITKREGIDGDITVTAENLPPGVTATPFVVSPDRNTAWLQLHAAADATDMEKPIQVYATGRGALGETKALATPQEEYRINNDPRYHAWSDAVTAVRGQANFTAEFLDAKMPIRVHPRKATPVKVRITRKAGFTGNVTVYLSGLPLGWTANPEATAGNELTLNVRPDGNNPQPFLNRDAKWSPILATLEASSDEFRFAFGAITVERVKVISDKDD